MFRRYFPYTREQGRSEKTMTEKFLLIENIPAVIYGDKADKVYLFIHGKWGYKEEASAFALVACSKGYQVLGIDLPGHGERKGEMDSFVPWKIVPELKAVLQYAKENWTTVSIRANSIGAYFCLLAFEHEVLERALFVSPILSMEQLIRTMMQWANVAESELQEKRVIPTAFGETLDWDYYQYVIYNRILDWHHPTVILYAGNDTMTSRDTVDRWVAQFEGRLTVMEHGEHWFHTDEQLAVLKGWELENC